MVVQKGVESIFCSELPFDLQTANTYYVSLLTSLFWTTTKKCSQTTLSLLIG